MAVVASLVATVLLATAAADNPAGNHPSIHSSIPDIRTGEFWNPRRQNLKSGPVARDQSGSKRSVTQPADAETDNDFFKPIAEGFKTSLVQLRPVFVSLPDDEVDSDVNQGLDEPKKEPVFNDQTGSTRAIGPQTSTLKKEKKRPVHKSQLQKTVGTQLPLILQPSNTPQTNAFGNKHSSVHALIKHGHHVPRLTGAPNIGLQGLGPTFKPSQLVRKGAFPPEAFLPLHPSRRANSSQSGIVSNSRLNLFGSVNNSPLNGALSSLPQFSTQQLRQGNKPQGKLLHGNLPRGNLPQGNLLQGNLLQGNLPQGNLLQGNLLQGNLLQGILPQSNLPHGNLLHGNLPQGNLPQRNLPHGNLPQGNLPRGPQGNLPQGNLPQSNLPQRNLPRRNLPHGNLLQSNLPQINLPQSNLPQSNLPQSNLPHSNLLHGNLPQGNLPRGNLLQGNLPHGNLPQGNLPQGNLLLGREIRSKKKSVVPEQLKFNPSILDRQNSQKLANSPQLGKFFPSLGPNLNFGNAPQFAPKPVSQGRGRIVRKQPGALSENTLITNVQVPTGVPNLQFVTEETNLESTQSVNNTSTVVESDFSSQENSEWQDFIFSEINKWATTDQEAALGNDASNNLNKSSVHLSVTKSIPAHKFTILDNQFQTKSVTDSPSTQQKRSEDLLTEVHQLEATRVDETNREPTQDFSLQLQNQVASQQTAFPLGNTPNFIFQRRILGPEINAIPSDSLSQPTEGSKSSLSGLTKRDSQSALFSSDDSFLKQLSQRDSRPRTVSITSEKLRKVLGETSDSTNLSDLNVLNASQKIALLQNIHKTLEEQAVKKPKRNNGAIELLPARFTGVPSGGTKLDRDLVKKLSGKHILGIQQISGFKHRPLSSVHQIPQSFGLSHKEDFQEIQPTKFLTHQTLSTQIRPDSTQELQSQKLSLDEKFVLSGQQLQSDFPPDALITQNLHRQVSARQQPLQNLPREQPTQTLSHSNLPRQHSQGKTIFSLTGQKLESPGDLLSLDDFLSPSDLLQNTPQVSFLGQAPQSGPERLSPQTSIDLLNQTPSSTFVKASEHVVPLRSQRTTNDNLNIIQLEAVKLDSKNAYFPRLPLEAQSTLRNSFIPQQNFEIPVAIATVEDSSLTPLGSTQKSLEASSSRPSKVPVAETSDLTPVASSEVNTHSLREVQNIQGNSETLDNEEEILHLEVPLQRQGAVHRPNFPGKRQQFRKSPLLQTSIGRDFIRVANPPSISDDAFLKGFQNEVIQEEDLSQFPDIGLFIDYYGRAPRISPEVLNEGEINFDEKIVEAPPTFRVPRPIQTRGSEFAPNEVEQLPLATEPQFEDYEDLVEREKPSAKHSPLHHFDRDLKFFPRNGYNINPFFRGFPSFGYFDKSL